MEFSTCLMVVAAAFLMTSTTAQPIGQDIRSENGTGGGGPGSAQYDQAAVDRTTTSRATTYQSIAAATADQSAAIVTADEQPAADQPATDQPAADQPAADQPAVDQPAVDQPAVNQPAGNYSAVNQSAATAAVVDKQPQSQYSGAEQHGPVSDHNNVTAVHGFGYNTGIAQADQADRNHHSHRAQAERVSPKNNVY